MVDNPTYFEGILQMRNCSEEALNFIVSEVEKTPDSNIAQIKKVTNGYDLYISKQKSLRSLGNKLQNKFPGQLTISKKLHTVHRLSSKKLYRVNLLFRMPDFKKGDILTYKGDKIKIISMHKKVFAKNIASGKKLNLNYKDIK